MCARSSRVNIAHKRSGHQARCEQPNETLHPRMHTKSRTPVPTDGCACKCHLKVEDKCEQHDVVPPGWEQLLRSVGELDAHREVVIAADHLQRLRQVQRRPARPHAAHDEQDRGNQPARLLEPHRGQTHTHRHRRTTRRHARRASRGFSGSGPGCAAETPFELNKLAKLCTCVTSDAEKY